MSISFNGSTSKLIYDAGASLGLSYPFALFAWLKPTSAATNQMVFGLSRTGFTREAMIYAEGGGSGKMRAFHVGDVTGVGPNSTTSVSTAWTPALAVFTSDTSRTIYYGAGAAVTESSTDTDLVAADLYRVAVGVRAKEDTLFFAGDIAEVAIWSGGTALGQTEFDALAAGAVPDTVSSGTLFEYWDLTTDAATQTGVNGLVLTKTSTSQGADHPIGASPQLSGSFTLDDFAFTGTLASAPASSLLGTLTLDDFVLTGTLGLLPGRVDTPPFKNWTGTLLPGVTVPNVVFLKLDRTIALALTSQTTAGDAVMTVENAALVTGTSYVMVTYNADGTTAGAQLVVAA